jgi:hypothetical protein
LCLLVSIAVNAHNNRTDNCFAFVCTAEQALLAMKDMCDFPMAKIVYVMTDFTESNFKFWADHPALKPFVGSGQLDMAIFDAVNDTTIKLSRSGVELTPGSVVNPICIVANYLFDTLCHDVFQVLIT